MLEFPGQALEKNLVCLWGEGPRGPLGHLWAQAWRGGPFLILALLFLMVWELSGVRLSVQLSVNISLSHLFQDHLVCLVNLSIRHLVIASPLEPLNGVDFNRLSV